MQIKNNYFPFMKFKWLYLGLSLLLIIPGTLSLIRYGLRLSIDFTGGTLLEIQSQAPIDQEKLKAISQAQNIEIVSLQTSPDNTYLIRSKEISQEQNEKFKSELSQIGQQVTEKRFETVGPVIGSELTRKSFFAVLVASAFIVIYISWSFREIPKPYSPWKFGASAVLALVHDVVILTGLFSILGHFYNVEVDALFITAVLTVIGFSVHDTIVVFDRVRENLPRMLKVPFEQVVDYSLTETLARSLNTSVGVILTLTALLLFGGETIRWFVVALLVGIISGTYSSIFNASPILVLWESRKKSNK
jgi:preprotein translocase subunit SecF